MDLKQLIEKNKEEIEKLKSQSLEVIGVTVYKQDEDGNDLEGTGESYILRQPRRHELSDASRRSEGGRDPIAFSDHLVKCCVVAGDTKKMNNDAAYITALGEEMAGLMTKTRNVVKKL